jgi:Rrf2 family iron-sulfur cluster assembly transcriptional regulator
VVSSRGPGGGYRLQRPSTEVSIGEVFRAVEETGANPDRDWPGATGITSSLWSALDDHIRDFLESVTVADVMSGKFAEIQPNGSAPEMANSLSA